MNELLTLFGTYATWKIISAILAAAIVIWLGSLVTKRTNHPAVLIMVLFVAIIAAAIVSGIFWLWLVAVLVAAMYIAFLFFSNGYTLRRAQIAGRSSTYNNRTGVSHATEIGSDEWGLSPNPIALDTSTALANRIDRIFNPGGPDENQS